VENKENKFYSRARRTVCYPLSTASWYRSFMAACHYRVRGWLVSQRGARPSQYDRCCVGWLCMHAADLLGPIFRKCASGSVPADGAAIFPHGSRALSHRGRSNGAHDGPDKWRHRSLLRSVYSQPAAIGRHAFSRPCLNARPHKRRNAHSTNDPHRSFASSYSGFGPVASGR
jgi:hypothetical protein